MPDPTPRQQPDDIRPKIVHLNLSVSELIEFALKRNEGFLSNSGALCVKTGKFTGRAPENRYIVDDSLTHDTVNWGTINHPLSEDVFAAVLQKVKKICQ
jgi:phosphoenolpyruvate carboxykinase (ATP)